MEVRCGSCNKLFRVSDDKISGSGIKFSCSRCGEYVKITKQDFEQYSLAKASAPAPTTEPERVAAAPAVNAKKVPESASVPIFKEPSPAEAEIPPVFIKPTPSVEQAPTHAPVQPKAETKKEPPAEVKKEPKPAAGAPPAPAVKTPPVSRPAPVRAPAPPATQPAAATAVPYATTVAVSSSSGGGKKIFVIVALILAVAGGVAYGVKVYVGRSAQRASDAVKQLTAPDGLQVTSATGAIDPVNSDLVITGVIENTTDKPKPAWYVVAEVYDAQGGVLFKGKLLSGKQLYTKRDYDILAKRGVNVQELRMRQVQEQGVIIPAKGATNFTLRIMEPPVGVASFNATLQPFDPVQLFKELAEEQKQ